MRCSYEDFLVINILLLCRYPKDEITEIPGKIEISISYHISVSLELFLSKELKLYCMNESLMWNIMSVEHYVFMCDHSDADNGIYQMRSIPWLLMPRRPVSPGHQQLPGTPAMCSCVHGINSFAPGRFEQKFRYVIFKLISVTDGWGISCKIALRWMPLDLTDDKSTLVEPMLTDLSRHMVSLGHNELTLQDDIYMYKSSMRKDFNYLHTHCTAADHCKLPQDL